MFIAYNNDYCYNLLWIKRAPRNWVRIIAFHCYYATTFYA